MIETLLGRIEIDPDVTLGKPVIRGTRITVEILLEKLAAGISIAEILEDYPALDREIVALSQNRGFWKLFDQAVDTAGKQGWTPLEGL